MIVVSAIGKNIRGCQVTVTYHLSDTRHILKYGEKMGQTLLRDKRFVWDPSNLALHLNSQDSVAGRVSRARLTQ